MIFGEKVNSEVRKAVKKPLGKLYSEDEILSVLSRTRKKIIAVGDETGRLLSLNGIKPFIWIYDGKIMRKRIKYKLPLPTYIVKSKKSTVSLQLQSAIDDALSKNKPSRIFVIGEEDMATLYAIYRAKNAVIVYGQPKKGTVLVKADRKSKLLALNLLKKLE